MNLLIAPSGSGKTTRLMQLARERTGQGKRVWWAGLPSQRAYVYRRATEEGALLGLEFLSLQQVFYRLVAGAMSLKPLLVGTGRIALVGEALMQQRHELPAPGEARLFTRAIAEAKRYGLGPEQIPGEDEETNRFRAVFHHYEKLKADPSRECWDYDDFRIQALRLAEAGGVKPETDLIIVDGFREIGPVDVRLLRLLSEQLEVWLSLPEAPPGMHATETLPPAERTQLSVHRAANPVSEARWVLRSLKRDLAQGADPLSLAVVLPGREVKAFLSLADEYGVPLMDETPKALADSVWGRLLLDVLELPDYPTASRLLAIEELAPLANAALKRGVAGREALTVLAGEVGVKQDWQSWLSHLDLKASQDELAWAKSLIDTSLPKLVRGRGVDDGRAWERFKDHALARAKEAAALAKGANFRAWWAGLLQETFMFERPQGGVALLTANLVSGRRFARVYLMHAVEGAYSVGEGEDYFVPEELRKPLAAAFKRAVLPKRFLGRDRLLFDELLTRGDALIVSYPEADQGGPMVPEPVLTGALDGNLPPRLPALPAGSRLEISDESGYQAPREPLTLGSVSVQKLMRYDDCAFRYWAESRLGYGDEARPWWLELVHELRERGRLNTTRFKRLREDYPQAAAWLSEQEATLLPLNFGVTLPEEPGEGPRAYLDAAGRSGSEVRFYRFVEPGSVTNASEASEYLNKRWNELWAAGHMLERYTGRVKLVRLFVWPVLGTPTEAFEGGVAYRWRRIETREQKVKSAFQRFQQGDVSPNPGFRCRSCWVFDVCREGQR